MKSKYELPFSTAYVPDWTYVEAFRELFQNALDNEISNPENKMLFWHWPESETVRICNKSSSLEMDSLLLGSSTKANDPDTIGKHGEGYKIAFLVLLREGKEITVYNYGKREVWNIKLVKSKRYNNQFVPVITVSKEAIWDKTPDNDLTIEVKGVTCEEYAEIVRKNLHLREIGSVKSYTIPKYGRILLNPEEKGNLYVKGLFVCNEPSIKYGYDFEPHLISLDRDRKLIQSFKLIWETSAMWKVAFANKFMIPEILEMIQENTRDLQYLSDRDYIMGISRDVELNISNSIAKKFIRKYGADAIPVKDNSELQKVQNSGAKAVLVSSNEAAYIEKATIEIACIPKSFPVSEELRELLEKIADKLSCEEIDKFAELIERVVEMED